MRVWFFIFFWVAECAWGASSLTTRNRLNVYSRPVDGADVEFAIPAGQSIQVSDGSRNGYKKIRAKVDGQVRTGFILIEDLRIQKETRPAGSWGIGGGPLFSRFSQGGKSFTTKDQVNYSISGYTGQGLAPALILQFGDRDFWRIGGHYRTLELTGIASTDVPGAPTQTIKLTYKMVGAVFEMAWSLWGSSFYIGGGAGYDKTLSGSLYLGSQDLSSSVEFPSFLSGHGLIGYRLPFSSHWAAFAEGRAGLVGNQSPMILAIEATAQVIYWP